MIGDRNPYFLKMTFFYCRFVNTLNYGTYFKINTIQPSAGFGRLILFFSFVRLLAMHMREKKRKSFSNIGSDLFKKDLLQ